MVFFPTERGLRIELHKQTKLCLIALKTLVHRFSFFRQLGTLLIL